MLETALFLQPGNIFCVATQPDTSNSDIAVIILNAGLLPSPGPYRLHIDIARTVAKAGNICIRMDRAGKGESPSRNQVQRKESLRKDYEQVWSYLQTQGIKQTILVGLCSGADDSLDLIEQEESIGAIVIMDGYAPKSFGYYYRQYLPQLMRQDSWGRVIRRWLPVNNEEDATSSNELNIRNWDKRGQMLNKYRGFIARGGRILTIFTRGASGYYNCSGQLKTSIGSLANTENLKEVHMSDASHTYSAVDQRKEVVEHIGKWIKRFVDGQLPGA